MLIYYVLYIKNALCKTIFDQIKSTQSSIDIFVESILFIY